MRDPIDEIKRALGRDLVDGDGDPVALALSPGLSPHEIDALAGELGVPLPGELRRLLAYTAGVDGVLETLDFGGRGLSFGGDDMFPSGHAFAGDGSGNHWVLDLTPEVSDVALVFYACHDPAVVVFQSASLGDFVHEVLRKLEPPHASLVHEVHEDAAFRIWRTNPGVLDRSAALAADDELGAFARTLDGRYLFVDLRRPEIGDGFSWGRFGPRTEVRRHGYERLFAYAAPEKRPGLLARLRAR
jgi:hypothetical protein